MVHAHDCYFVDHHHRQPIMCMVVLVAEYSVVTALRVALDDEWRVFFPGAGAGASIFLNFLGLHVPLRFVPFPILRCPLFYGPGTWAAFQVTSPPPTRAEALAIDARDKIPAGTLN